MRYQEGSTPGELGPPVGEGMLVGTAVFGLLVGIGFVVAGRRARQLWLTLWGASLVTASLIYLGALVLGFA